LYQYGHRYFLVIWHILPRFGMLYQEKSGNPDVHIAEHLKLLLLFGGI
jgi:hypothetical protein